MEVAKGLFIQSTTEYTRYFEEEIHCRTSLSKYFLHNQFQLKTNYDSYSQEKNCL